MPIRCVQVGYVDGVEVVQCIFVPSVLSFEALLHAFAKESCPCVTALRPCPHPPLTPVAPCVLPTAAASASELLPQDS